MPQDKNLGTAGASQAHIGGPNATAITESLPNALAEGKPLADDGDLYSTVQDAENAASSWVFVPPGTFNESVTIDTAGLTLEGSGYSTLIDGGTTGKAIVPEANDVTIRNLSVSTDPNADNGLYCIHIDGNLASLDGGVTVEGVVFRESDDVCYRTEETTVPNSVLRCRFNVGSTGVVNQYADGGDLVAYSIVSSSIKYGFDSGSNVRWLYNIVSGTGMDAKHDNITIGNRVISAPDYGIWTTGNDAVVANNRISDSATGGTQDTGSGNLFDGNNTNAGN